MIDVVEESEFVITPLPETKVHSPVPDVATLPDMSTEGEEMQIV